MRLPQQIEHQLAPVVELDGKPIPARLIRLQFGRTELVIHPADALDRQPCAVDGQRAGRAQARHRVVVRRARLAGGFGRDAVVAVNRRRLLARLAEVDRDVARAGDQMKRVRPGERPIVGVHVEPRGRGRPGAERRAREPLEVDEAPTALVGECEVRGIELIAAPGALPRLRRARTRPQAETEERQLVAEAPPVTRAHVPGVVPPLRGEPVVRRVIARKDEVPGHVGVEETVRRA